MQQGLATDRSPPMPGVRWQAAHLATLLLLATVGVVRAGAKPAPPPTRPTTTNSTTSSEDNDYYYDDDDDDEYYYYDDYDYNGEGATRHLNLSEFHLPEGGEGRNVPHVPRYMLELYADQNQRGVHHAALPGADVIRSFLASTIGTTKKCMSEKSLTISQLLICLFIYLLIYLFIYIYSFMATLYSFQQTFTHPSSQSFSLHMQNRFMLTLPVMTGLCSVSKGQLKASMIYSCY